MIHVAIRNKAQTLNNFMRFSSGRVKFEPIHLTLCRPLHCPLVYTCLPKKNSYLGFAEKILVAEKHQEAALRKIREWRKRVAKALEV